MTDIAKIARHWIRQTELGKGMKLSGHDLDVLNSIGVGKLIADALAEHQQEEARRRMDTPSRRTRHPYVAPLTGSAATERALKHLRKFSGRDGDKHPAGLAEADLETGAEALERARRSSAPRTRKPR